MAAAETATQPGPATDQGWRKGSARRRRPGPAEASVGRAVTLKVELLPDEELAGAIANISERHLEYAPPALSNKYEGPLATTTDSDGRERLNQPAYQATVRLEGVDPGLLRAGLRGNARLLGPRVANPTTTCALAVGEGRRP